MSSVGGVIPFPVSELQDALVLQLPRDAGRPPAWGSACWLALGIEGGLQAQEAGTSTPSQPLLTVGCSQNFE